MRGVLPGRHGKKYAVLAVRPAVLPLVSEFDPSVSYGCLLVASGTREDLVGAGLAWPELFDDICKSGCRTRRDEFGARAEVRRLAGGRFEIVRYVGERPNGDLSDHPRRWPKALREGAPAAIAVVAEALERIAGRSSP